MLNSSCGDGMRPVSNFDQIGMSFKLISKAPDDTNCEWEREEEEEEREKELAMPIN